MANKADPAFELGKDARKEIVAALIDYCDDKLDWELGNLDAAFLLDWVTAAVGPAVYNRAIRDAQEWLAPRVSDLEGELWKAAPDLSRK